MAKGCLVEDPCGGGGQQSRYISLLWTQSLLVQFQMSDSYQPENYTGFLFDEPLVEVRWPVEPMATANRDRGFVHFTPLAL